MKITKLLSVGFFSALMLSSCLGDSESKISGSAFAYRSPITSTSASAVKLSNGYQIQFESMNDPQKGLAEGECATLSFTLVNPSASVNQAEDVKIQKRYPVEEHLRVNFVDGNLSTGEIYPSNFAVASMWPNEFLGDKWLFNLTTRSNEVAARDAWVAFYFDKERQKIPTKTNDDGTVNEEDYKPVEANQVIIDVRVFREAQNGIGTNIDVKQDNINHDFVGDFRTLRNFIRNPYIQDYDKTIINIAEAETQKYIEESYGNHVAVMFRFIQEKERTDKTKYLIESYSGSWNRIGNTSSSVFYSLLYPNE